MTDNNNTNQATSMPSEDDSFLPAGQIDRHFSSLGCVESNASSRTFLARTNEGNFRYTIKITKDNDDGEAMERELQVLQTIQRDDPEGKQGIVSLARPILSAGGSVVHGVILPYFPNGTLDDEIRFKSQSTDNGDLGNVYTERRIAKYAVQMASALHFIHERGFSHWNVQSSNFLVDRAHGHRLVLGDFSHAMEGHQTPSTYSLTPGSIDTLHAAPEVVYAYGEPSYTGLIGDKIDAFGLGCILVELVSCRNMTDLTDAITFAEFLDMQKSNGGSFLDLGSIKCPWEGSNREMLDSDRVYSSFLKSVMESLVAVKPSDRATATHILDRLRTDSISPLVKPHVSVAVKAGAGDAVTVDNLQLGMFVQRGLDWADGEERDGGTGSIGVVVGFEIEASAALVAWPVQGQAPLRHRIGAEGMHEIQAGPTEIPNFYGNCEGYKSSGMIHYARASEINPGHMMNAKCMVVAVEPEKERLFITTIERYSAPSLPVTDIANLVPPTKVSQRLQAIRRPQHWEGNELLVEVTDYYEGSSILQDFHKENGGLDTASYEVVCIERIQSESLWNTYGFVSDEIALDNWGTSNEKRVFHGTGRVNPKDVVAVPCNFERMIANPQMKAAARRPAMMGVFNKAVFSTGEKASLADRYAHVTEDGLRQVLVCTAAFGRSRSNYNTPLNRRILGTKFHSKECGPGLWALARASQVYPEYILTYKLKESEGDSGDATTEENQQNNIAVDDSNPAQEQENPNQSTDGATEASESTEDNSSEPKTIIQVKNSPTKMCVICLENPVNYVFVPCGHACLCATCCSTSTIGALHSRCPECRGRISTAVRFFGRIVNDEEI